MLRIFNLLFYLPLLGHARLLPLQIFDDCSYLTFIICRRIIIRLTKNGIKIIKIPFRALAPIIVSDNIFGGSYNLDSKPTFFYYQIDGSWNRIEIKKVRHIHSVTKFDEQNLLIQTGDSASESKFIIFNMLTEALFEKASGKNCRSIKAKILFDSLIYGTDHPVGQNFLIKLHFDSWRGPVMYKLDYPVFDIADYGNYTYFATCIEKNKSNLPMIILDSIAIYRFDHRDASLQYSRYKILYLTFYKSDYPQFYFLSYQKKLNFTLANALVLSRSNWQNVNVYDRL